MAVNMTREAFEKRKVLQEGEREISNRAYNLILGGVLLWGFALNYLMVTMFERQIYQLVSRMSPVAFIVAYLVLALLGSVLVSRPSPVLSFIGFNLIAVPLGALVCLVVPGYPVEIVKNAVLMTAFVTVTFMALGVLFPNFFLGLGRVLGIALLVSIIAELAMSLIWHTRFAFMDWGVVAIFSLYIGYDWARANTCARTVNNAVDLAANLYLDIINLFLRILRIMGKSRD